jgi:hypothetical protein
MPLRQPSAAGILEPALSTLWGKLGILAPWRRQSTGGAVILLRRLLSALETWSSGCYSFEAVFAMRLIELLEK